MGLSNEGCSRSAFNAFLLKLVRSGSVMRGFLVFFVREGLSFILLVIGVLSSYQASWQKSALVVGFFFFIKILFCDFPWYE